MTYPIDTVDLKQLNANTKLKTQKYKGESAFAEVVTEQPGDKYWGEADIVNRVCGYVGGFFGCCGVGILALCKNAVIPEVHSVMAKKYSCLLYLASTPQTSIRAELKKLGYKDVHAFRNSNSGNHVYIMSWTRAGCEGTVSLSGESK